MKTDLNRLILYFLLILLPTYSCSHRQADAPKSRGNSSAKIEVSVFKLDDGSGWGYEIIKEGAVFIRQEYIPVFEGKQVFQTKEDALKVGTRVRDKLKQGESPALTRQELTGLLKPRQ